MKNNKNTKIIIVALLTVVVLTVITACAAVNGKSNNESNDEAEILTEAEEKAETTEDTKANKETEADEVTISEEVRAYYEYLEYIGPYTELPSGVRTSKKLLDTVSAMTGDEKICVQIHFRYGSEVDPDKDDKFYFYEQAAKKLGIKFDSDSMEISDFGDYGRENESKAYNDLIHWKNQLWADYLLECEVRFARNYLKDFEVEPDVMFSGNFLDLTDGVTICKAITAEMTKEELLTLLESDYVVEIVQNDYRKQLSYDYFLQNYNQ